MHSLPSTINETLPRIMGSEQVRVAMVRDQIKCFWADVNLPLISIQPHTDTNY
jgi:hypothetical protein